MTDTLAAFFRRYDKIYNPEANDRALLEKELTVARRAALLAPEAKKERHP